MSAPPDETLIEGAAAFAEAAAGLATNARLELCVLSFDLQAVLYGTPAFADAVRALALRGCNSRILILINDQRAPLQTGHRLIEVGRRLSSAVEFRTLGDTDRGLREELLIADGAGLLARHDPEQRIARLWPRAPARARQARKRFQGLWEAGETALELRRLDL